MEDDPLEEELRHMLATAIGQAVCAHGETMDKGGMPYILHPIAVMQAMNTTEEKIVAILHDVVEDTWMELSDLSYLPEHIWKAVDALTKRKKEKYEDYLKRVKENKLALSVKMADIAHNTSVRRLEVLDQKTRNYLRDKYRKALVELNRVTNEERNPRR